MRKIFISAGHSNKLGRDCGAAAHGFVEGKLAVSFRDLVYKKLIHLGANVTIDGNDTILSDSINYFKKLVNKNAIVLDIHFNSGPSTATGTETFVPKNATINEMKLARKLSEITSYTLDIVKRGDKGVRTELESHHKKLGWMSLLGENVLTEICFISNKEEIENFIKKEEELAEEYAMTLFQFAKNSEFNQPEHESLTYTVRSGDTLSRIAQIYGVSVNNLMNSNNLNSDVIHIGQPLKIKKS